ncbi:MAG: glutaminyl-peptide cyclotransferase [Acidimicrobiales bacterium]
MNRPLAVSTIVVVSVIAAACGASGPSFDPVAVVAETRAPTAQPTAGPSPEPTTLPSDPTPTPVDSVIQPAEAAVTSQLAPSVVAQPTEVLGHDPTSFTQGLVFDGARLYESRGLYGESALTEIDPTTGEVLRRVDLPDQYFAEGLALDGDRLVQITWLEEVAFVYDVDTFEVIEEFSYEGQGWGLCHDGEHFWMSDGSDILTRRDSTTFGVLGTVNIRSGEAPVSSLNELECLDGLVWANVYQTDQIAVIDPTSGDVVSMVSARGLVSGGDPLRTVLNGIAYDETRDTMVITGKLWPAMFEVDLVEP